MVLKKSEKDLNFNYLSHWSANRVSCSLILGQGWVWQSLGSKVADVDNVVGGDIYNSTLMI